MKRSVQGATEKGSVAVVLLLVNSEMMWTNSATSTMPPPISVCRAGVSPRNRNTQSGVNGTSIAGADQYIPLTRGSIFYDVNFKADTLETPVGNYTNAYNIVHIDRLTGRARIERTEIKR